MVLNTTLSKRKENLLVVPSGGKTFLAQKSQVNQPPPASAEQ